MTLGGKRVYVSGDTACIPEMKALTDIDIAFVTMNLPYTMPPEEAAECVKAFKPKIVYPYHYRGSDLNGIHPGPGIPARHRSPAPGLVLRLTFAICKTGLIWPSVS